MLYDLVIFPNGTASLKPKGTTEPMHSSIGAWTEAQSLYVGPSRLQERLTDASTTPLVVYDVGMGIAANALAALQCALNIPSSTRRGLHVVSFENDLNGLRPSTEFSGQGSQKAPEFLLRKTDFTFPDCHAAILLGAGAGVNWPLQGRP